MIDPACGTAGFMIAAFKHVLASNTSKGGKPGDQLTPDERKKLADSFRGYDIDPGMVASL